MNRGRFLSAMATLPFLSVSMKLDALNRLSRSFGHTEQMPVLFLGHGSPMNAIEENEFVTGFKKVGEEIPKPQAILCISAHWETKGTFVTAMENPRTIHDFGGFPPELYEVQYPAPGNPSLAKKAKEVITTTEVTLDQQWGLDHGSWSVIKHLYPDADVPVVQLSLDYTRPPQDHYDLAKELAAFRKKGVLIVGSGNMVHNLRKVAWHKLNEVDFAFDWAQEASGKMKDLIAAEDHKSLIQYTSQGTAFRLAIPTAEHYLPLLYALALKGDDEELQIFNDKAVGGAITMTSVKIG